MWQWRVLALATIRKSPSAGAPVDIQAGVFGTGNPPYYAVSARAPKH